MSQNQGLHRPNQLKRIRSGRRAEAAARELYREEEMRRLSKTASATPAERAANALRRVSELLFRNAELRKENAQLQAEILRWIKKAEVLEQVIADSYVHDVKTVEVVVKRAKVTQEGGR